MKSILMICTLAVISLVQAQDFTLKPTGDLADVNVVLENLYADLEIEGTTGAEIQITVDGYEGIPEKAAGLKPLSAMGPENTGIGLNIQQTGNIVSISGAHRSADDAFYRIRLPKNVKLKVEYKSFQAGDVRVTGMTNEVDVNSQIGDLTFVDVTGPIVANSLSSDIEVVFTSLNQASPTSITSTSGDIDVTLPASAKGEFNMSSTSGEVYSDHDFQIDEEDGLKRWGGGMSVNALLNGGGVEVTLRSISGNIYIRQPR